jgi:molybdate transport system substrate-binding protein
MLQLWRHRLESQTGGQQSTREYKSVLVLSVSSTHEPIGELTSLFHVETGIHVSISTGGSNALASQVMAGVPADMFLSANTRWAETVEKNRLASGHRPLMGNRLVMVVPSGNPGGITTPQSLMRGKTRYVAIAGEDVPAGLYAEQALRHAGVYDSLVSTNRIARGQNVDLTLGYVERGEAEAGVVYATDARAARHIEVVYSFPEESHDAIVYSVMMLKNRGENQQARLFYDYLFSPKALEVFMRHGFLALDPEVAGF